MTIPQPQRVELAPAVDGGDPARQSPADDLDLGRALWAKGRLRDARSVFEIARLRAEADRHSLRTALLIGAEPDLVDRIDALTGVIETAESLMADVDAELDDRGATTSS